MKKNSFAVMGALALGSLLLGGCSAQPGVAASVGNTVHTQDELNDLVHELSPFLEQGGDPNTLLTNLILAEPYLEEAARYDIGVGEQEAAQFLDEMTVQYNEIVEERNALLQEQVDQGIDPGVGEFKELTPPDEWADSTIAVTRLLLLPNPANEKGVWQEIAIGAAEELEQTDIEINPRYGTWESGRITPEPLEWMISVQ